MLARQITISSEMSGEICDSVNNLLVLFVIVEKMEKSIIPLPIYLSLFNDGIAGNTPA